MPDKVIIIGGGLAGSEAAWQIAKRGYKVILYEMRPVKSTPAHKTDFLSELVCSNSLRSNSIENTAGLLKEELRILDSCIMKIADETLVPAGSSLSVDREKFAYKVTNLLSKHKNITLIREEVCKIPPDSIVIIATGPLTSDNFSKHLKKIINNEYLYFYDAISPIIDGESINYDKTFFASRYNKGGADYLNCPLNEKEYYSFIQELLGAEKVTSREFEDVSCFEACMPIEDMAGRGEKTLLFGPLKPVGLYDPENDERLHAVVQLRKENVNNSMFNMVGFQTKLTYSSQKKIFRMIPGLERAEFLRYGSVHRNTFINSPVLLLPTLQLKDKTSVFFSGQITGIEGYIESVATGLIAGINAVNLMTGKNLLIFPNTTSHGALIDYITNKSNKSFQPMHINFGLFPPLLDNIKNKKERRNLITQRALKVLKNFKNIIIQEN